MDDAATLNSVSSDMQEVIARELDAIESRENVRLLFAIESGSRAWGFPSPDSDYDVRFVYARPVDWYLSLEPGRDVIELPLEGDLDINGWDIKKTLSLLLKPNPVALEWLSSPIRYRWNDYVCDDLIAFSQRVAHGPACLHHYLHLGGRQWQVYVEDKVQVNLKKYLYVVRPAMAIRWIRLYPEQIPPMNFHALRAGIDLPQQLTTALMDLLDKKSRSKELGEAPRIEPIDRFIEEEFNWAREAVTTASYERKELRSDADDLFRKIIGRDE